jgi:5-methylcytosine-specific restriction endonuclease McrA
VEYPQLLEDEVRTRDKNCIYCGVVFDAKNNNRKCKPTWEHIVNDAKIINSDNIALCCASCNASKGAKELSKWLESDYCKRRNINHKTVAAVVKRDRSSK